MSHSITRVGFGSVEAVCSLSITDYVLGGETVSPSEIQLADVEAVLFMNCSASQNSLGKVLIPILIAGKIVLVAQNASGVLAEIPATTALNASIKAVVFSSNYAL